MNQYPDAYPKLNDVKPPLGRGESLLMVLGAVAPFLIAAGAAVFMFWYSTAHGV